MQLLAPLIGGCCSHAGAGGQTSRWISKRSAVARRGAPSFSQKCSQLAQDTRLPVLWRAKRPSCRCMLTCTECCNCSVCTEVACAFLGTGHACDSITFRQGSGKGSKSSYQECAISWQATRSRDRSPASSVGVTNVRHGFCKSERWR